jgi:hypothetical protein
VAESQRERGRELLMHAALYLADSYPIRYPLGWDDHNYPIREAAQLLCQLETIVTYGKDECPN